MSRSSTNCRRGARRSKRSRFAPAVWTKCTSSYAANVELGHQAYIVAPAIDEESELTSVVAEAERLKNDVFPDLRIGLLHGRMTPSRKGRRDGALFARRTRRAARDDRRRSRRRRSERERDGHSRRATLRARAAASVARTRRARCREIVLSVGLPRRHRRDASAWTSSPSRPTASRLRKKICASAAPGEFAGTVAIRRGRPAHRRSHRATSTSIGTAKADAESIVAADPELRNAGARGSARRARAREPSTRALVLSS